MRLQPVEETFRVPESLQATTLSNTLSATTGQLRQPSPTAAQRQAAVRSAIAEVIDEFNRLDDFDLALHKAPLGTAPELFAKHEAVLVNQARVSIAIADGVMLAAAAVFLDERALDKLKARRDEWHAALEWKHEDYADSPEFMDLLKSAVEEYEAGNGEEGGFGP